MTLPPREIAPRLLHNTRKSAMTTPRGIRNNNPGNIERVRGVRWQGEADEQTDERFVVFREPRWGIRAIARVLVTYQDARRARDGSRIDTVAEIVERWAPPVENDTGSYARAVEASLRATLGAAAEGELDVYDWRTMRALVVAIIRHENGVQPYDDATIDAGLALAGIKRPARTATSSPTVWATVTTAAGGAIAAAPAVLEGVVAATGQAGTVQSAVEAALGEHGRVIGAALALLLIIGGAVGAWRTWRANQQQLGGAVQ